MIQSAYKQEAKSEISTMITPETTKVILHCALLSVTPLAIITASLKTAHHFDLSPDWGLAGAFIINIVLFSYWVA